ncbi:MAG: TIGR03089 family protein, partial [Rothia sp. (in: high G+C Gram-positive bacteria)]|nr:TIGR03089 family protein [Rothia sp. (in: high G+C Gram-positive bacteria)]
MTSSLSTSHFTVFMSDLQQRQTPALIWYSSPGERIELSGRVLDNWVSKSANFLVDECEVDAGAKVVLSPQLHWRSVIVALAALRTGAQLRFDAEGQNTQVQVSFSPDEVAVSAAEYPVILDRGPLAMRFMGQLPAGVTDYCAEVRSHADVYGGFSLPSDDGTALEGLTYGQLMQRVGERAGQLVQRA